MLIFSGDTHGDVRRFSNKNILHFFGEYPSHILIAGDFGLIWSTNPENKYEKYWLKWLDNKPWITLVCKGNHENHERISNLPLVSLYGGKARRASEKVFFLENGDIFHIENKNIFVFGGATSIDKEQRRNQITWWPEEVPNYADEKRAFDNLGNFDNSINIVLTHTAPISAIMALDTQNQLFEEKKECHVAKTLEAMMEYIPETAKWYCGHMHEDIEVSFGNRKIRFLYKDLIKE